MSAEQDESFSVGMATTRSSAARRGWMFDVSMVHSGLERQRTRGRGEENWFDPAQLSVCSLSRLAFILLLFYVFL